MIPLPSWWRAAVGVGLILLVLASTWAGGWRWRDRAARLELAELRAQQDELVRRANAQAGAAAASYEAWKRAQRPQAIRVAREVDRATGEASEWSGVPLPGGVRDALAAAAAVIGAGEPDGAVPAAGGASAGDQR